MQVIKQENTSDYESANEVCSAKGKTSRIKKQLTQISPEVKKIKSTAASGYIIKRYEI